MKLGQPAMSVVLCTYNRAEMLQAALESLHDQSLDETQYEMVVVNNASTDHTIDIIAAFQSNHPSSNIVLVYEERQGLAYSRNTGWKHARGVYVAFLDDDCLAPRPWLKSVLECFQSVNPEPWSVGGPILPKYDVPKPKWFKDDYEQHTWGEQGRFLQRDESFFGGNMAFKRSLFEQYGGFDLRVGMSGLYVSTGEETGLYERIWQAAGSSCLFYYCPQAIMYHRVSAPRMTIAYQLKRAFAEGQASHSLHAPQSPGECFYGLIRTIGAWLWHGGRALMRTRPVPFWENWVVEAGRVLAFHTGRVAGGLGLRIPVKGTRKK